MNPLASIVISAFNEAEHIRSTVDAIFRNCVSNFELIVVDDASTDETLFELEQIGDSRLTILKNLSQLGIAASLNRGLRAACGEYVFFTGADCRVSSDWIRQGLDACGGEGVIGVEGDIFYPTVPSSIRFKVPCNPFYHSFTRRVSCPGRDFAGGNIVFRRDVMLTLGGFNESEYGSGREDTELAWRAMKLGRIAYNPSMSVEHRLETWTWKSLLRNAKRYEKDVLFFRDHGFFFFSWQRIIHPRLMFFPCLIWKYRRMPLRDYALIPAFVVYALTARLFIWRGAIRYRTLVV